MDDERKKCISYNVQYFPPMFGSIKINGIKCTNVYGLNQLKHNIIKRNYQMEPILISCLVQD